MKLAFKVVVAFFLIIAFSSCGKEFSKENKLVIYCPHPVEFIDPIISEFENSTGIEVKVIRAGTGELISRIEHEVETGNRIGDVLWGGSFATLSSKKELFLKYYSKNEDQSKFENMDGYLSAFSLVPSVIMVNTNLEGKDKIESYDDLLNPEYKGKIAYANPLYSASSYEQLINMLWATGEGDPEKGWDYVEKLIVQLDGNLLESSSKVYNGVAQGEYTVGLTFEEGAANFSTSGAPVRLVYPTEGTIVRCDGVAIIDGSDNVDKAKQFVDFVTSLEIQTLISEELNRRSVRDDIDESVGLVSLNKIKLIKDDEGWSSDNKQQIIDKFIILYNEYYKQ